MPVQQPSRGPRRPVLGNGVLWPIMTNLSEKARASQQNLREASAEYQAVVDQVIEDPRGQFVEKLRRAEERVSEAAARWALDYVEGVEPESSTT